MVRLFFFFSFLFFSQWGHTPGHEEKTRCAFVALVLKLVKKYEQWKNSSYLFVGFGESPFLQNAHAIPLGLFSLFFSLYSSFALMIFLLLPWSLISGHTSTPSSSSAFVFLLYPPFRRDTEHTDTYQITGPVLSLSLPAELSITGSDVDRSERGQTQSERRKAVILSASVCSWPHFKLNVPAQIRAWLVFHSADKRC